MRKSRGSHRLDRNYGSRIARESKEWRYGRRQG